MSNLTGFERELTNLINHHSLESWAGNTPDFILAGYLMSALTNWRLTSLETQRWYNVSLEPGRSAEGGDALYPTEVNDG